MKVKLAALAVTAALCSGSALASSTARIANLAELPGAGATSGTNFKNGILLARDSYPVEVRAGRQGITTALLPLNK